MIGERRKMGRAQENTLRRLSERVFTWVPYTEFYIYIFNKNNDLGIVRQENTLRDAQGRTSLTEPGGVFSCRSRNVLVTSWMKKIVIRLQTWRN
jgi:hypothetical protein